MKTEIDGGAQHLEAREATSLAGRVALVTGAGGEIGRVIAARLHSSGASVCLADINGSSARLATDSLEGRAMAWQADITDESSVADLLAAVISTLGPIDILVNNAALTGTPPADKVGGRILEIPVYQWRRVLDVNLTGAFICSQLVGRQMATRRRGAIINISSIQGVIATRGSADYCVSKAGLIMLTKCLAGELGQYGIRVNAVAPGTIVDLTSRDESRQNEGAGTLLGRWGLPTDVAGAVAFLASDASSFIDGDVLMVDGGGGVRFRDQPR